MSVASSTDVHLFKDLANAEVVDVEVSLSKPSASKRSQSLREALEQQRASQPREEDAKPSAFREALSKEASSKSRLEPVPEEEPRRDAPSNDAPSNDAPSKDVFRKDAFRSESKDAKDDAPKAEESEPPKRPPKRAAPDDEEEEAPAPKRARAETPEERTEKQGYLIELYKLERNGVKLTREFTMADSVAEMEFELGRHNADATTQSMVAMMKRTLQYLIVGIELGNSRFGPFLSLDGWAESATADMSNYDHALERIYKRYWKKQQMSPVLELVWALGGSLIACHFKNKFSMGAPAGTGTPAPPPRPEPRQERATSSRSSGKRAELRAPLGGGVQGPSLLSFLGAMRGG